QKLRYGMTFEAAEQLRQRAAAQPGNAHALNAYVDALVREGNFGRAFYLIDLYGAKYNGPGAEGLEELRKGFAAAQQDTLYRRPHEVRKLPAGEAFKEADAPAYQALLYLDGYRHAALGDWASAKNLLGAIEEKRLAPPLRPYYLYFLSRAYRLAGDSEEKAQLGELFERLMASDGAAALKARAKYN
ncbi:MAG: hypothetical protein M3R04_10215, partial [bacterium]|nr:hypothetical protein [bacterium]